MDKVSSLKEAPQLHYIWTKSRVFELFLSLICKVDGIEKNASYLYCYNTILGLCLVGNTILIVLDWIFLFIKLWAININLVSTN